MAKSPRKVTAKKTEESNSSDIDVPSDRISAVRVSDTDSSPDPLGFRNKIAKGLLRGRKKVPSSNLLKSPTEALLELNDLIQKLQSEGKSDNRDFKQVADLIRIISRPQAELADLDSAELEIDSSQFRANIESYLENKEKRGPDTGGDPVDAEELDNEQDTVQWHLDAIAEHVLRNPSLAPDVCMHGVFEKVAKLSGLKVKVDRVALEIARDVKIRWSDRFLAEYKDEPWIENASTFIAHVYSKWLKSETLKLKHLLFDEQLYKTYTTLIRRDPSLDLGLCTKSYSSPKANIKI